MPSNRVVRLHSRAAHRFAVVIEDSRRVGVYWDQFQIASRIIVFGALTKGG